MFEEISSSDRESVESIIKKRVFERLTTNSNQIKQALQEDPKQDVYNLVAESQNSQFSAEDLETLIRLNIYSTDIKPDKSITVGREGSDTSSVDGTVSGETYDTLKSLTIDPEVIQQDVKYQVEKRPSF